MRFILQILFIFTTGLILALFFPWWCVALAGFIGGFALRSNFNFSAGFVAIALLWSIRIMTIELSAVTPLTEKVAHIFNLPGRVWLILLTSVIGGFVGGMGALTGSLLQRLDTK